MNEKELLERLEREVEKLEVYAVQLIESCEEKMAMTGAILMNLLQDSKEYLEEYHED